MHEILCGRFIADWPSGQFPLAGMALLVCESALLGAAGETSLDQNPEAFRSRVLRYVARLFGLAHRKANETIIRSVVAVFQFQIDRPLLRRHRPPSCAP